MFQRRSYTRRTRTGRTIVRESYSTIGGFDSRSGWWDIRKKVVQRAGGKCESRLASGVRCSAPLQEVHHIRPLSAGGTTTMANLLGMCMQCHNKRHGHLFRARG